GYANCSSYLACCTRDLHSFPTRRSSDLRPGREDHRRHQATAGLFRPQFFGGRRSLSDADRAEQHGRKLGRQRSALSRGQGARNRSEEHTSELQSRRELVCRLLLEKKKII